MSATHAAALPRWSVIVPIVSVIALLLTWGRDLGPVLVVLVGSALVASVLAAVHHAEVVALRVGEPYGTLILAVAVTVIEVALIVTLMISGGDKTASLARDTVFAAQPEGSADRTGSACRVPGRCGGSGEDPRHPRSRRECSPREHRSPSSVC